MRGVRAMPAALQRGIDGRIGIFAGLIITVCFIANDQRSRLDPQPTYQSRRLGSHGATRATSTAWIAWRQCTTPARRYGCSQSLRSCVTHTSTPLLTSSFYFFAKICRRRHLYSSGWKLVPNVAIAQPHLPQQRFARTARCQWRRYRWRRAVRDRTGPRR